MQSKFSQYNIYINKPPIIYENLEKSNEIDDVDIKIDTKDDKRQKNEKLQKLQKLQKLNVKIKKVVKNYGFIEPCGRIDCSVCYFDFI
jgi:hypothetical protein